MHERHFFYFLSLAKHSDEHVPTGEQKEWLMRLEIEHHNLRAALEWSRATTNQEYGLELAAALIRFWARRGYFAEGQYWLELMLASPHAPALIRAKALSGLGTFKYMQGHFKDAASFHTQALALFQEAEDASGTIDALRDLGVQFLKQTDYLRAQALFEQSLELARRQGNSFGIQRALHGLGACALNQLEPARAQAFLEEALRIAQQGQDKREIVYLLIQLGSAAGQRGDSAAAADCIQASLELARELGDKWGEASALIGVSYHRRQQGNLAESSALGKQGLRLSIEIDSDWKTVDCLEVLARTASASGSGQRAARLFGAAEILRHALQYPLEEMDLAEYAQWIAAMRAQLDENTFARAWAEGRAMTKAQAIAYALADD